jgi:hypothetical protein
MPDMLAACVKGFGLAVLCLVALFTRTSAFAEPERAVVIACHIRVTQDQDNQAVRIEAVASSRKNLNGEYRFEVLKRSATGTSHNVQGGAFDLKADTEDVLTTTFLDASALGHYQAKLVLDTSSGSVSCVSP